MRSTFRFMGAAAVALLLFALTSTAQAGGVIGSQVSPIANIQAYKLGLSYATDAAYVAAFLADCQRNGVRYPGLTGKQYYNTTLNAWRYWTGAAWATSSTAGAGQTLNATYAASAPPTIARTANGTLKVTDATADGNSTFELNRSAGAGVVLKIVGAGTGNDITGDLWSVDTNGKASLAGAFFADDKDIALGNTAGAPDVTLQWDTAAAPDGLLWAPTVDSTPVYWGSDQHGMDQFFWGDAGASAGFFYDASEVLFRGVAGRVKLADASTLELGSGAGDTAAGDFTLQYDGTRLLLVGPPGDEIRIGADGDGHDLRVYGDTLGDYVLFDSNAAGDQVLWHGTFLRVDDGTPLVFGAGAGPDGDLKLTFDGGTGDLAWTQTVAGVGTMSHGVNGKGISEIWYSETAGSYMQLDQANDQLLFATENVHLNDGASLVVGSGAGAAGDMSLSYAGGTDVLTLGQSVAGTGSLGLGVDGKGVNTTFYAETAGDYAKWDQAAEYLEFVGADAALDVDSHLRLGSVANPQISGWDVTSDGTDLTILSQTAAGGGKIIFNDGTTNSDVEFGTDSGALLVDWNANQLFTSGVSVRLSDADQLIFGTDSDVGISWVNAFSNLDIVGPNGGMDITLEGAAGGQAPDVHWADHTAGATWAYVDLMNSGSKGYLDFHGDFFGGMQVRPAPGNPVVFGADLANHPSTDGVEVVGDADDLFILGLNSDATQNKIQIGYDGTNNNDTDLVLWGTNGAGADAAECTWDYGADRLAFTNNGGEWFDATNPITWGNTAAAPKMLLSYTATGPGPLTLDTDGVSNNTFQVGTTAANHTITLSLSSIPTYQANQVSWIDYSATAFGAAVGPATWNSDDASWGWKLADAATQSIQMFWTPAPWVASADVAVYLDYSCDNTGNVGLTMSYLSVLPGTTLTSAASTDDAHSVACGTAHRYEESGAFTIAAASVVAGRPVKITVARDGVGDANNGSCFIHAMRLKVTRSQVN